MYQEFAEIYDAFAQQDFYEYWLSLVKPFLKPQHKILDLGCGSGTLLNLMAPYELELTGVDLSSDMLSLAQNKLLQTQQIATLYQQDMVEFFMRNEQYDIIVSTCDSINYINSKDKIDMMFQHIQQMLTDTGIFIFDMHSDYTFEHRFADWSYADASLDMSVLWNIFSDDGILYEHNLTFFIQQEDNTYHRFDEVHNQYFYQQAEIKRLLNKNNLELIKCSSDFSDEFKEFGERTFYFVRKKAN